jgi:hypothetical protein
MMRHKLLAHMQQGLESRAVYQFVREHPGLVARWSMMGLYLIA